MLYFKINNRFTKLATNKHWVWTYTTIHIHRALIIWKWATLYDWNCITLQIQNVGLLTASYETYSFGMHCTPMISLFTLCSIIVIVCVRVWDIPCIRKSITYILSDKAFQGFKILFFLYHVELSLHMVIWHQLHQCMRTTILQY